MDGVHVGLTVTCFHGESVQYAREQKKKKLQGDGARITLVMVAYGVLLYASLLADWTRGVAIAFSVSQSSELVFQMCCFI